MAIRIYDDRIEFNGNTGITLRITPSGLSLNGKFTAQRPEQRGGKSFGGTIAGYSSGGYAPGGSQNTIDKFPFTTDTNASDVGDLSAARYAASGHSSAEAGFTAGGIFANNFDKFPFAFDANAASVGTLPFTGGGVGHSSPTHGYISSIRIATGPGFSRSVQKFPFIAVTAVESIGDLPTDHQGAGGCSSAISGYTAGGRDILPPSFGVTNTIDKFSFITNGNGTDVGDLTIARATVGAASSQTHGYIAGGYSSGGTLHNTIDKFSFQSDANASDVGDMTETRYKGFGNSSQSSGYFNGGFPYTSRIEKLPFATDTNSSNIGSLTQSRYAGASQEV